MGIEINCANLFLRAKEAGVPMESIVTVGRQNFALSDDAVERLETVIPASLSELKGKSLDEKFAETFFQALGFSTVHSVDVSDYESCTHLHDLNAPIPDEWRNQYDVVFDGGSLEHVFNLPVALKNCMEMVKTNGHFMAFTPCNGFMGHGFYQFSPELFYRVFSEENGFELRSLVLIEMAPRGAMYLATDPATTKARTYLESPHPISALVIARKLDIRPVFQSPPQQSDYSARWLDNQDGQGGPAAPGDAGLRKFPSRWVPGFVLNPVRRALRRRRHRLEGRKGLSRIDSLEDITF